MLCHRLNEVFLAHFVALIAVTPLVAAPSGLAIAVNDSSTHQAVQSFIEWHGPALFSGYTDEGGHIKSDLNPGEYVVEASASGYKSTNLRVTIETGKTNSVIIMLDPLNGPEEDQYLSSRLRPSFTLIHGYVTDEQGQPMQGVRVRSQGTNVETNTDPRGYYWLSLATPPETDPDIPGTDTLVAEKAGYATVIHHNVIVSGEDGGGVLIGMKRGNGIEYHDDTHKLMQWNVEPQSPQPSPKKKESDHGSR